MVNLSFRNPSSSSHPCHTIAVTDEAQTTTKQSRFWTNPEVSPWRSTLSVLQPSAFWLKRTMRVTLSALLLCLRRHYDTRQSSSFPSEEGKRANKYTPNDLPWSVVQERVPGRPFAVARIATSRSERDSVRAVSCVGPPGSRTNVYLRVRGTGFLRGFVWSATQRGPRNTW